MSKQQASKVVMEACSGANYWARRFQEAGHEVSLIAAQYVKPYVKRNKNDRADAEAIAEASLRPTMNFVGPKSVSQQDMQCRHRVRERMVKARTALANEIGDLSLKGKSLIKELLEEFHEIDKRIKKQETMIKADVKSHPVCQRLMKIDGVGERRQQHSRQINKEAE